MFWCFSSSQTSANKRKRVISVVFFLSMILLVFVVVAALIGVSADYKENPRFSAVNNADKDRELTTVHVVFRHGARTPADTYPNDPYVNETFYPFGWGQLTNVGKTQLYELGKLLRKRYGYFLGDVYSIDELVAQSTGVSRTKMSIQLVLAGLFPPKGTPLEWNKELNWMPVPYDYEPLDKDTLLLVRTSCPRYHEEWENVHKQAEIRDLLLENSALLENLTKITGLEIHNADDVQSLYSTLKAEKEFGLKLPQWTKDYFPDKLQCLTDKSYIINAYNDELKKLKGGVFIKKLFNDWQNAINHKKKSKFFLYAGHDSTVTNLLTAFNVWEQQFPNYGVTAFIELYKNKKTSEYEVDILLKNTTPQPEKLTVPGCDKACPIDKLKELLKNVIPLNMEEECKAISESFTEPPLGGP